MASNLDSKFDEIAKLFQKLYVFSNEEVVEFLDRIKKFPEKGLDELLKTLQEGQKSQDVFFTQVAGNDRDFPQKLSQVLKLKLQTMKNEFEVDERESAESILKDL